MSETGQRRSIVVEGPGQPTEGSAKIGKLVIIRHGLSEYNINHRFTGWHDPKLTDSGMQDALKAGLLLKDISFACAFTSILYRAQVTLERALTSAGQLGIPVVCEAALNERDYGDLNGMDRAEAVKKFGQAKVQKWRRSYSGCPPGGESLKTTAQRTIPYLQQSILPVVMSGRNVIVSSHGNTIRAIVMYLMEYSTEQVLNMEIERWGPLVFLPTKRDWVVRTLNNQLQRRRRSRQPALRASPRTPQSLELSHTRNDGQEHH